MEEAKRGGRLCREPGRQREEKLLLEGSAGTVVPPIYP